MKLVLRGKDHVYLESFPQKYGPILRTNPIFNLFDPEFLWRLAGVATTSHEIQEAQQKMNTFFHTLAAESKEKIRSHLSSLNKVEEQKGEHIKIQLNVMDRLLLSLEQGYLSEKEVFGEVISKDCI